MKYLIWDFDGTLGTRPGGWSGMLAKMLCEIGIQVTADDVRPYVKGGFTWAQPEIPHPELDTPDKWWDTLDALFVKAFAAFVDSSLAEELAHQVRKVYPQTDAFHLYEDTLPTLDTLSEQGWTHIILTNHVPEFDAIAAALGVDRCVRAIFNSAEIGYEKPHPQAYRQVLASIPDAESIWMLGDNLLADVQGAEALGIPAILVRNSRASAPRFCATLQEIPDYLASNSYPGLNISSDLDALAG